MAITITQAPQLYTPSDNPVLWVFSSTNTGQTNFSFIVELYINGALDSTHQVFTEVGTKAHYDASDILKARIPAVEKTTTTIVSDASNHRYVFIKIYERYGATPTNQNLVTSSTTYVFKACLSRSEFQAWDYTDYLVGDLDRKFLTDAPLNQYMMEGGSWSRQIITNNINNLTFHIIFSNSAGTPIDAIDLSIPLYRITTIDITFAKILAQTSVTQATLDDTNRMELYILSGGVTLYSETRRVFVNRDDCKVKTQLSWINKYGAYDQFLFTHNQVTKATVEQKSYSKQFGGWVGTSYTFDTNSSGTINYKNTTKKTVEISSGWLSETVQNWLVQLYESPVTFMTDENGTNRVTVSNTSYDVQQSEYEELFNEIVNVEIPNEIYSITL